MTTTTGGSGSNSDDDNNNNNGDSNNRAGDDVDDNDPLSETQPDGNQGGLISSSNRRNIRNSITTSTYSRGDEESSNSNRSNSSINTAAAERRRRVLFGVLFRLLVNGRDQRRNNNIDDPDDDEDRAQQQQHEEEPAAAHPLRILTQSEAESLGAICRICFEGATAAAAAATTTTTTNNENPLLSPCNCSGGSQWIHKQCLRQWQRYCTSTNNSRYCNVCQTRYTLRPPRLRTNFDAGNILVYMDTTVANGTFSKTLVLIANHRRNHSTFGLIINSPMNQQRQQQIQNDLHIPSGIFDVVSWRRGGPVCGGRLGVTRYIVAHTLPLPQGDEGTTNHINIDDEYVSQPVLPSDPRLHFIYSQDETTSPTTFDQADLQDIIQKLANLYRRQSSSSSRSSRSRSSSNNSISNTTTVTTTTTTTTHLFVFAGYSQWGRGQLCREISRGAWGVCEDGSLDDLIRPLNSNYYDQLVSNNDNENSNTTNNPNPTAAASNGTAASRRLLLGSQLIYEDD